MEGGSKEQKRLKAESGGGDHGKGLKIHTNKLRSTVTALMNLEPNDSLLWFITSPVDKYNTQ